MNSTTYIEENKDRFLNELLDLLKIPSISANPDHKDDIEKCAEKVADSLKAAGADNVEVVSTPGYPVVYGEKIIDPDKPTVMEGMSFAIIEVSEIRIISPLSRSL